VGVLKKIKGNFIYFLRKIIKYIYESIIEEFSIFNFIENHFQFSIFLIKNFTFYIEQYILETITYVKHSIS
jgi:hypothetical protein